MNDQDRLQQAEDNFNAGDDIYTALGVQQDTMRKVAQESAREADREASIEYYMDEGYPQELAEEYADAELLTKFLGETQDKLKDLRGRL